MYKLTAKKIYHQTYLKVYIQNKPLPQMASPTDDTMRISPDTLETFVRDLAFGDELFISVRTQSSWGESTDSNMATITKSMLSALLPNIFQIHNNNLHRDKYSWNNMSGICELENDDFGDDKQPMSKIYQLLNQFETNNGRSRALSCPSHSTPKANRELKKKRNNSSEEARTSGSIYDLLHKFEASSGKAKETETTSEPSGPPETKNNLLSPQRSPSSSKIPIPVKSPSPTPPSPKKERPYNSFIPVLSPKSGRKSFKLNGHEDVFSSKHDKPTSTSSPMKTPSIYSLFAEELIEDEILAADDMVDMQLAPPLMFNDDVMYNDNYSKNGAHSSPEVSMTFTKRYYYSLCTPFYRVILFLYSITICYSSRVCTCLNSGTYAIS